MAGYKELLFQMKPVAFYSFDGDTISNDGKQFQNGVVIDEMGNSNATISQEVYDNPSIPCYLVNSSMVLLDKHKQYSMRFCPYNWNEYAVEQGYSGVPKAYLIAPNCVEWDFSKKEFTYIMLYRSDGSYHIPEQNGYTHALFEHNGIITVGQKWTYSGQTDGLIVKIPGMEDKFFDTVVQPMKYSGLGNLASFLVFRFREGKFEIIRDLDIIFTKQFDYFDNTFTLESGTKELTIGGTHLPINSNFPYSDRLCSKTDIDQFCVFNRYVSDNELAMLYRRIWTYSDIVINKLRPNVYFRFAEKYLALNNALQISHSNTEWFNLIVEKGANSVITSIEGDQKHSTTGMGFYGTKLYSTSRLSTSGSSDPTPIAPISVAGNFTLWLSLKVEHGNRGLVFSQARTNSDHEGITVWAHSENGQYKQNSLELMLDNYHYVSITPDLLDASWHTICIRKTGDSFDIWFDGLQTVQNYEFVYKGDSRFQNGINFFSSHLMEKPMDCILSEFIVVNSSVSTPIIWAINDYEVVYHIRGSASLNGNPAKLTIRAYSHSTGELISQTTSDPETGVWMLKLLTNTPLDLLCLDETSDNVKLKCYGTIIPAETDDDLYYLD